MIQPQKAGVVNSQPGDYGGSVVSVSGVTPHVVYEQFTSDSSPELDAEQLHTLFNTHKQTGESYGACYYNTHKQRGESYGDCYYNTHREVSLMELAIKTHTNRQVSLMEFAIITTTER